MDQRQQRILTRSAMVSGVTLALGLVGFGFAAEQRSAPGTVTPAPVASVAATAREAPPGSGAVIAGLEDASPTSSDAPGMVTSVTSDLPPAAPLLEVARSVRNIGDSDDDDERDGHRNDDHDDDDEDEHEERGRR